MTLELDESSPGGSSGQGATGQVGTDLKEPPGTSAVSDTSLADWEPVAPMDLVPGKAQELPMPVSSLEIHRMDSNGRGTGGGEGTISGGGPGGGQGRGRRAPAGRFRAVPGKNPGLDLRDLEILHEEIPDYPQAAYRARIQGEVVVRITIDESGIPIQAILISGHPVFQAETMRAARLWRFGRGIFRGSRVEVTFEMIFRYRFE